MPEENGEGLARLLQNHTFLHLPVKRQIRVVALPTIAMREQLLKGISWTNLYFVGYQLVCMPCRPIFPPIRIKGHQRYPRPDTQSTICVPFFWRLGLPVVPFYHLLSLFEGGFPYQNRLQKKVGTLILTSLLEDLGVPIPIPQINQDGVPMSPAGARHGSIGRSARDGSRSDGAIARRSRRSRRPPWASKTSRASRSPGARAAWRETPKDLGGGGGWGKVGAGI